MCLDTVDEVTKEYTEGYKVFGVRGNFVNPELYNTYKRFPLHEWIGEETNTHIYYGNGNYYKSGFHFFVNLEDAYTWIQDSTTDCEIFKVRVRNIIASGEQRLYGTIKSTNVKVGVAKEMYIEKELP